MVHSGRGGDPLDACPVKPSLPNFSFAASMMAAQQSMVTPGPAIRDTQAHI